VRRTALVAIIVAVIFFLFGLAMNYGIGITFSFAIGTFVAFIPQGLPVTVTLLLTIAAKRLAKKQVLVKDLQAVETLGSITVLATDKTGTLTQNKMSVVCIWMNNLVYGGNLDKLDQSRLLSPGTPNATDLLNVCGLCSKYR
jgi:sodium/potassium-transporting ATPase subunit alpha